MKIKLGYALCGSFCTLENSLDTLVGLAKSDEYDIYPIVTEKVYSTDTRFGKASDIVQRLEDICSKKVIKSITEAEPIGPKKLLDILVISPCTGGTLAKFALGITDTSVTMAAKSHIRNSRPVLISLATNDAMSANLQNIGTLLMRKNVYFTPLFQDDPTAKPSSLVCDFSKTQSAIKAALEDKQLCPLFLTV